MKLIFDVSDKPKAGQLVVFALQQMLAILAATIAVPLIIGNGLTPAAAMFGAGVGTIVYIFFTKRKSPVFLGSSFAFLGSMAAAFAGGVSMQLGMLGLIVGAFLAGLVYVVIAIVVKLLCGGIRNKLVILPRSRGVVFCDKVSQPHWNYRYIHWISQTAYLGYCRKLFRRGRT